MCVLLGAARVACMPAWQGLRCPTPWVELSDDADSRQVHGPPQHDYELCHHHWRVQTGHCASVEPLTGWWFAWRVSAVISRLRESICFVTRRCSQTYTLHVCVYVPACQIMLYQRVSAFQSMPHASWVLPLLCCTAVHALASASGLEGMGQCDCC